jgi:outer membrane receptor protein involved in Fe transport
VEFRNRIDRPVLNNLLGSLSDPTVATFVTHISPATNAADLALITALLDAPAAAAVKGTFTPQSYLAIVDARYVNTTVLHVSGLDLNGVYALDVGQDRITFSGNASYMARYDQQLTPTTVALSRAGLAGFPVRLRSRAAAEWTHGFIAAQVAFNYIGAYHDPHGVRIADQPTFDLQLRAAPDRGPWKGLGAALTVRNVFDRAPPFYNNAAGVAYDPANADPIGRFVSLQLTKTW